MIKLNRHRQAIADYVDKGVCPNRAAIWKDLAGHSSFLDRHDRAWLASQISKIPMRPRTKQRVSARHSAMSATQRDVYTVNKLREAVTRILAMPRPCRVTRNVAIKIAGLSPSIFDRLRRGELPATAAFFQEVVEPYRTFIARKLEYGFDVMAKQRNTVILHDLRRACGLTEATLIANHDLILKIAAARRMPINSRATAILRHGRGAA